MIRLIANPREYNGQYVRAFGYLRMVFEGDRLFVQKVDCDQALDTNGVSIGICRADMTKELRALSAQYVLIEGKVWCKSDGASLTLWNVTRVERWPPDLSGLFQEDSKKEPNPEGSVERSRHRTLDEQARHE